MQKIGSCDCFSFPLTYTKGRSQTQQKASLQPSDRLSRADPNKTDSSGTDPVTALSPHLCRSTQQGLSTHNTFWNPSDPPWVAAGSCVSWILLTQPAGIRHGGDHNAGAQDEHILPLGLPKYGSHAQQCVQRESVLGGCCLSPNPTRFQCHCGSVWPL